MQIAALAAFVAAFATAQAATIGFNYGSTFTDGSAKQEADFEAEFKAAQNLAGTSGEFTSARLYTMIQGATTNTPISAIQAAINTKTTLLLGLWASAGQANIDNEIAALKSAISTHGTAFTDLIVGISVGSEDLYRDSVIGIENDSGVGAAPSTLVTYINQVRTAIAGTAASNAKIGHVDTWNDWVNGTNNAVIEACDWLGMDTYPYFENTHANGIDVANTTFYEAYDKTVGVSSGKEVWVTETGWPVSGPQENQAIASIANAETYWQVVGCSLFGKVNTWWYVLDDALPTTPNPSFGILTSITGSPLYDLTCSRSAESSSSSSSLSSASASSSIAPTSSTSVVSVTASTAASSSSPATISSAPTVSGSSSEATFTTHLTTHVTITTCPSECTESATATATATASVSASSTPSGSASSCPTNLNGEYQYPHLIVPVSSAEPNTAYGTQYNATISTTISTIFNFDIPASYQGKTCSLVFLFPEQADLETSAYTFNGQGGISVNALAAPVTEETTYASLPSVSTAGLGAVASLQSGNGYVIATSACAAGARVAYEFQSTGGLDLEFFEDWNPSPLGAFVTVC
nr:putative glucan endo-1,3-beta-glucosidase eglc [Quercus suber]